MLAGRYAGSRIPDLKPRIELDLARGSWSAKSSVPFLLYSSGGTIPDRGYFTMRDLRTGTASGELDEEFVWERQLGDRFALGAQVWKIAEMDDLAVRVEPVEATPHIIPFWSAEGQDRSWFLAEKIGVFLEEADRALSLSKDSRAAWKHSLVVESGFSEVAVESLNDLLVKRREWVGALPHRWRLAVEHVGDQHVILHTFCDKDGCALETYPGDDQVMILIPPFSENEEPLSPDELFALVAAVSARRVRTGSPS